MLAEPLRGDAREVSERIRFIQEVRCACGEPQQEAFRPTMSVVSRKARPRCQHADCGKFATKREAWRIDDAVVVVRLCDEHAFKGAGARV